MEEQTVKLQNAYYRNVLFVIEDVLGKIPRPAHVVEKQASKSITEYYFQEPIRVESFEKQQGRITINYSITKRTQFASMAGLVFEKDPIVFECYQGEDNTVVVRGYWSTNKENSSWIKAIFGNIWQQLLNCFSD